MKHVFSCRFIILQLYNFLFSPKNASVKPALNSSCFTNNMKELTNTKSSHLEQNDLPYSR